MKLGIYTLNLDGTIPDFVINGGYFPHANQAAAPQDWKLIGWVTDDSGVENVTDLRSYLISIGAESWRDRDGNVFDLDTEVAYVESLARLDTEE